MTTVYNSEPSGAGSFAYAFQEATANEEITFTPGGSFAIAAFPEIDKPVKLKGAGATVEITGAAGLRLDTIDLEMHDLTLDGGDYCIAGTAPGLVLKNVRLTGALWNGAHIGNSPNMVWDGVEVDHASDNGIELYRGCDGTVITGLHSHDNGRLDENDYPWGYGVMNLSHGITATKSVVEGNTRTGWLNYNCYGSLLEDSDFRGNGHSGINNDGSLWAGAHTWRAGALFEPNYEDTGDGQCTDHVFRLCRLGGDPTMTYRMPNGKQDLLFFHARDSLVEGCDIFGHKDPLLPAYHGIAIMSPITGSLHSRQISVQGCRIGVSRKNNRLTGDGYAIYVNRAHSCVFGTVLPNLIGSDWQGTHNIVGEWAVTNTYSTANKVF